MKHDGLIYFTNINVGLLSNGLSCWWWNILISSLPITAFLSPAITFTLKLLVPWAIWRQGSHDKMKFPLRITELICLRGISVNIRKQPCPPPPSFWLINEVRGKKFSRLCLALFSAAKTALNTFLFSKEASHLEKDLMKTLKVSILRTCR